MNGALADFCRTAGFDKLKQSEQAIRLIYYVTRVDGYHEVTLPTLANLFVKAGYPPVNSQRLADQLRRSKQVFRTAGGHLRLFPAARQRFDGEFDPYFRAREAPPSTSETESIERVSIDSTPLLTTQDIASARRMTELYKIIHCYENSARKLVETVLSKKLGTDWWDKSASATLKNKVKQRIDKEAKAKWISPRGTSPLFYIDWGDLLYLMRSNTAEFEGTLPEYKFVESRFEELERFRNIVAHNGALPSDDDFQHVVLSFKQWCKQIGT